VSEPLGLGLVGTDSFGTFCPQAYAEMPDVAVVAVADVDLQCAQRVVPPGARAYGDYDELLADPAVEIVAINTPPYLHGAMARQAAQAGKHVFVEKPLATSMEEATALTRCLRTRERPAGRLLESLQVPNHAEDQGLGQGF
jgi:predicted dehydrogenase